jgi:hypothetical protein
VVPVVERTNTELWRTALFAASWYNDALAEARRAKGDIDARRREIVFAACFLESYLFEWTNVLVGPRAVDKYLPLGDRDGIRERWKRVIKDLELDKKIGGKPSFGGADWVEFITLIQYRDGLVHAHASRSTSDAKPDATPPVPPVDVLREMEPGWPVRVVADLVRSLHAAVGSSTPHWLVNP